MLHAVDVDLVRSACHGDPFSVLGPHHQEDDSLSLRVFLPGAEAVTVLDAATGKVLGSLALRHEDGFFEATLPALSSAFSPGADAGAAYRLQVNWRDGRQSIIDDPYRFAPLLTETDAWLLGAGSHLRPHEVLGAAPLSVEGVAGTRFATWAPDAARVSVVGDFNHWDGRRHAMRPHPGCGVWEIFVPAVAPGALYKYEIRSAGGGVLPLLADVFALQTEAPPATASVVAKMPDRVPASAERQRSHALDAPVSIYQVDLGSWRRRDDDAWPSWDELAGTLLPYVRNMGFTHLELLPVQAATAAHAAQPPRLFAPSAHFGEIEGLRRFVERCHAQGTALILDWLPASADELRHTQLPNFLVGNALYWLERYDVDGLQIDAVASMLGPDPDALASNAGTEAAAFLKRLNDVVHAERPQALTLAGASAAVPAVSRPAAAGGLGFDYKCNAGWAQDTLRFMARDPAERAQRLGEMSFGLGYAFDENFVLPLSHHVVAHGKGSLLRQMPGERWQQFASLRAYCGFMFGHPGKKLLFMGSEFAQAAEWNPESSLDWHLLADRQHEGVQRWLHDLNHLYQASPALYEGDGERAAFEWLVQDDEASLLGFVRRDRAAASLMLVVCNFSLKAQPAYRLGVPSRGLYRQRLDSSSTHYGGTGVGTGFAAGEAQPVPWHGRPYSLDLTLPPLTTVMIEWTS